MRNSQKENVPLLPPIGGVEPVGHKNHSLDLRKEKYFVKPKMSRILHFPIRASNEKLKKQISILEAFTNHKNYEELVEQLKEKEIEKYLRQTQIRFNDRQSAGGGTRSAVTGKEVQAKYYENYKKLEQIMNKKKLSSEVTAPFGDDDPPIGALQKADILGILPCRMGLVKDQGDNSILSIAGQKFGDKYISAISAGLKEAKLVQKCLFSNNRLTDKGFEDLLANVGHQISRLDVSNNSISRIDQKLLNLVLQPEARLQYLNLDGNLISDASAEALFRSSSYSRHLKYLNLRKNLLTAKCAEAITELLARSSSLEQLYIGMNRINENGATLIIDALQKNKTVKVFDYCQNKLGKGTPSCSKNIAMVLLNNKTLLHLDISENGFTLEESRTIGEALQKNKKIYGFHFGGNYGYVDSKGFLRLEQKSATTLHSIMSQKINSYDIIFPRSAEGFEPTKFKNVCWICEGWHEQVFKFTVPEPSPQGKNLVFIHFDFEEYEPRLINLTQTHVKYKAMVPPGKYKYFFTWNKMQILDQTQASSEKKINNAKPHHKTVKIQLPTVYTYEMDHQMVEFTVKAATMRSGKPKKIVNCWDQLIVSVHPRQIGLVTKKDRKVWDYKDSLWAKQWRLDDDQMIRNCFEKDWKNSKLMNLIKNQGEQEKVKELLFKNYRLIKQIYRYYSSWSPFNGDIWAVSNNAFTEFCHESKVISKDTPLKITDLTFITTNSMSGADWKGNNLVPERGLIRFQFMESIARLAEQKFKKNGLSDSILGSVTNMLRDHICPLENQAAFCSEKWRLKKYFIEENDLLLKKYRPIFADIYKRNSRMKVKPGNKAFMCLAEFKSIIERIGIAGSLILQRDIFLAFNCSMMTQVDETDNERFIRMTEIEFIEAVARCAFNLPESCKLEDIFEPPVPFHAKFEWIIHQLKNLCPQELKNQYPGGRSIFNRSQQEQD